MKRTIAILASIVLAQTVYAGSASTNMHVGATVGAWVKASNNQAQPSVETNSKTERCTIENTEDSTIVHC
ncbi:hypothetical protein [Paraburkholderia aromaticivorans]|uniref:hypothetical protein n=1 Tax=Paraburkholderia aromaticivorans TaxID=2026199 RepID=UPI0038BB6764